MITIIEDLIEMKENGYEIFQKQHPKLAELLWKVVTPRRFGMQFLDDDQNVIEEYTVYTNHQEIMGYDVGLQDPNLVVRMNETWTEEYLMQFKDMDDSENIILTIAKYIPEAMKAYVRGDIRLGRK